MRILCLGDVVGTPGREVLERKLPGFREEHAVDFCIVNIENVADGAGINVQSFKAIRDAGADVCTTGDHVYRKADVLKLFRREPDRLLRPLNYPAKAAGRGLTVIDGVAVLNLQGRVFMDPSGDPFEAVDEALNGLDTGTVVVDFHCEATSEKRAMGWYVDGRVSALVGTHTHVPTADEEVLPKGTAYVSDLGMCGPYASVIGRHAPNVLKSMTTKMYAPFDVATDDVRACGVIVDVDDATGRASQLAKVSTFGLGINKNCLCRHCSP